jgi:hypothetical protein
MSEQMTRDGALAFVVEQADELALFDPLTRKPTKQAEFHQFHGDGWATDVDVLVNLDGRGVVVRGMSSEGPGCERFAWKEVAKAVDAERGRAYARAAMAEIAAKRGDAA